MFLEKRETGVSM